MNVTLENLNLSETSGEVNITLSNTELCAVHFKRQNKKNIQIYKCNTKIHTATIYQRGKFDDHKLYSFLLFDTETNSTGRNCRIPCHSFTCH